MAYQTSDFFRIENGRSFEVRRRPSAAFALLFRASGEGGGAVSVGVSTRVFPWGHWSATVAGTHFRPTTSAPQNKPAGIPQNAAAPIEESASRVGGGLIGHGGG